MVFFALPLRQPFCNFFHHAFCPAHKRHTVFFFSIELIFKVKVKSKEPCQRSKQKDTPEKITPS
jgi:hypothetical protein